MESATFGKLYTSNLVGLRKLDVEVEIWQITRAGIEIPNSMLVRNLAPSPELFEKYNTKWRNESPSTWWSDYKKQFLDELQTEEKLVCLRQIYQRLKSGKNIVLVCFCKNYNYCHRRLVGEFFKRYNIDFEELDPITTEQLVLF
jgi:uncharacterized protein YeaO (DUF488 family)